MIKFAGEIYDYFSDIYSKVSIWADKTISGDLVTSGLVLLYVVVFALLSMYCYSHFSKNKNRKSMHSIIKIFLITIGRISFNAVGYWAARLEKKGVVIANPEIPVIIFSAIVILVIIWNFCTIDRGYKISMTIIHMSLGIYFGAVLTKNFFTSIIMLILILWFGNSSGSSAVNANSVNNSADDSDFSFSGHSEASVPSRIRDIKTQEGFHVTKDMSGQLRIERNGTSIIIRGSDYSGRYFDDYGNEYV